MQNDFSIGFMAICEGTTSQLIATSKNNIGVLSTNEGIAIERNVDSKDKVDNIGIINIDII